MSGGKNISQYVYFDETDEVNFPRDALSSVSENYFYGNQPTTFDNMQTYLDADHEVAFYGDGADDWQVLQDAETTYTSGYSALIAAFGEPVRLKGLHIRAQSYLWKLYATNDLEALKNFMLFGYTDAIDTLLENDIDTNVAGGSDIEISSGTAYKYYIFNPERQWIYVYDMSFKVLTGDMKCVLVNSPMTPQIKVYPDDYTKIITQPWYDGNVIVGSQTLIMKPYSAGGNLINYTDDKRAVRLEMYLLTGENSPVYILSLNGNFELPVGYTNKALVTELNLPDRGAEVLI